MMNPPTESESTEDSNYSESFEASSSSSTSSSEPTTPVKKTSRKPTPKRRVFKDKASSSSSTSSSSSRASSKSEKKESPPPEPVSKSAAPLAATIEQPLPVGNTKAPSSSSSSSSSRRSSSSSSHRTETPAAATEDKDVTKMRCNSETATTKDNAPKEEKVTQNTVERDTVKSLSFQPPSRSSSSSSSAASSRRSSRAASSSSSSSSSRRSSSSSHRTKSSETPAAATEDKDVTKMRSNSQTATTKDNAPKEEKVTQNTVERDTVKSLSFQPPSRSSSLSSSAASSRRSSRAASSSKTSVAEPPTSKELRPTHNENASMNAPIVENAPPATVAVKQERKSDNMVLPDTPTEATITSQANTHRSKDVAEVAVVAPPPAEKDNSPPPPEVAVPEKALFSVASSRRVSTSASSHRASTSSLSKKSSGAKSTPRETVEAKEDSHVVEGDDIPPAKPSVEKAAAPPTSSERATKKPSESEEPVDIPVAKDKVQNQISKSDSTSSKHLRAEAKEVDEVVEKAELDQSRHSRRSSSSAARSRSMSKSSARSSSSRKSSKKAESTVGVEEVKPLKNKTKESRPVSRPALSVAASVASSSMNVLLPPVERRVEVGSDSDIEVKEDIINSAIAEEQALTEEKPSRNCSPNPVLGGDETNDEKIERLQRQIAESRKVPRFPRKQKIPDPPRVGTVHSITSTSVTVNVVNGDVEGVRLYISSDEGESFHLVSCTDAPAIAIVNLAPNKPYRVLAVPVSQRFQSKRTAIVHFATSPSSSSADGTATSGVTGKSAGGGGGRPSSTSTNNKSKQKDANSYSQPASQVVGADRSRSRTPLSRIYTPSIPRGQRNQNRKNY